VTPENAKTQSWVAKNSKSTGPQQHNTDDHNCPVDTAERSAIYHVLSNSETKTQRKHYVILEIIVKA